MLRKTYILIALLPFFALLKLNAQVLSSSQSSSTVITQNLPAAKSEWSNPANASIADNSFTTTYVQNKRHSEMLVATNWGFSVGNGPNQIPSNAVINGFEVEIKMKGSNSSIRDYIIQLRKNNSINSNNLARVNSAWPETATYIKFGSSTNMWGLAWTPSDIAASTFGVEIAAQGRTNPGTAMIDHIKITVYFNLQFYYSKSAGNLTTPGTWGVNTDGSGPPPPNFSDSGQIFFLRNRFVATLDANLTISGDASKMIIGNGLTPTTLIIPATAALNALVDVTSFSTLHISNIVTPTLGGLDIYSTVAYNAMGDQMVDEVNFYHLTLGGSGTKTTDIAGNYISIDGNFIINTGITFNSIDDDVVVNGNVINSGTITGPAFIWMNGVSASTISGTNGSISNLRTDNDISVTLTSAQTITNTLLLTSFGFTTGANLHMSTGAVIVRDGGTMSATPASSNLYDVQYIGSTKTAGPEIGSSFVRDLSVSLEDSLPYTVTLSQPVSVNGDLILTSGTLDVTTGNYNITVKKNIIANSTLNNRSNTVSVNGSALQTISGTNAITFYRLTVNNAAGLQLQNAASVNNLLTFTNGLISTDNTNKLTLGSAATTTGANNTRYINGPLSKTFASIANTFTYPIGGSGLYRPVILDISQSTASPTTYTGEMINGAPPTATLPPTLTSVYSSRYYKVSKSIGANVTSASVTLSYDIEEGIISGPNTRVAQRNGGNWVDLGGSGSGNPSGNVRSTSNFTTFNEFVLADNTSALPVSLVSFKGVINSGIVKLQWVTNNEINIDHYQIEKSVTGNAWNTAGSLLAFSNSQQQNSYVYNDKDPYSGKSYYRLKIIDKNQTIKYSDIISIYNSSPEKLKITLRPSLSDSRQSALMIKDIRFEQNEKVVIRVFNSNGSLVLKKVCTAQAQLPLDFHNLSDGMYVIATEIKGTKYNLPFIIW